MFWQWLEAFLHRWSDKWDVQQILISIIAAALAVAAVKLLVMTLRWAWNHLLELLNARRTLRHALWAVSEGGPIGVWHSTPPSLGYPSNYRARMATSIPILTVANLKGGVGKTTVAANLAAHYAYQGERVLFIDLDFQGSSSSMMLRNNNRPDVAARLVDGGGKDILLREADPLKLEWRPPHCPNPDARGIPADYSLARADNRVMVQWLLKGYKGKGDARYWLANALLDPEVQARYSRVIIDAPPRMVAGKVQALCASTHVLIPTILDRLSVEAVNRFANQLHEERELWPYLRIAGVTAVRCSANLSTIAERDTVGVLIDGLEANPKRPQLFAAEAFIAQKSLLSQAAGQYPVCGRPYNGEAVTEIRDMFANLASWIERGYIGERTYEAWQTWLSNQGHNSTHGTARGNGFSESAQPPVLPL